MAVSTALPRTRPLTNAFNASQALFVALNAIGLVAYLAPFFAPGLREDGMATFAHRTDAPIVFAATAALCLVLVVADLTAGGLNSKSLAALGVLAALAAVLRTITLPAGANLYFFLVILGAYAFGPRMGFLLGALSFFLSAVVTGGFGPWLPFQMFAAAWMGVCAGWLGWWLPKLRVTGRAEVAAVVALGVAWGLLFGAITNLWSWPFFAAGPDISYQAGLGPAETLRRYWNYYILTSFGWDLIRSLCNAVILIIVGGPLLRALVRFRQRFSFELDG